MRGEIIRVRARSRRRARRVTARCARETIPERCARARALAWRDRARVRGRARVARWSDRRSTFELETRDGTRDDARDRVRCARGCERWNDGMRFTGGVLSSSSTTGFALAAAAAALAALAAGAL